MKRRFWVILSLLVIFAASGLAQQPQPLHFTSFSATGGWSNPTYFGGIPAEDGWIIQIVCTGPDAMWDWPDMNWASPNCGMPTGDDFLADSLQNGLSYFYHNGVELFGSGYQGSFINENPLICLPPGQGIEPVVNVGDWIYLRAFNSDHWVGATNWAQPWDMIYITYTTPGIADTLFDIWLWELPVEMTLFTATGGDGKVTLHWVTASEKENDHFNLYKAMTEDGKYSLLAQVDGQGTTPLEHHYFYEDLQVVNGSAYYYQIADVDINGVEEFYDQTVTATPGGIGSGVVAEDYELMQNYPNPFNASTAIGFKVLEPGRVKLSVYDLLGREVAVLVDAELENNTYEVIFEAGDLPAGVYFYELAVNEYYQVEKMVLVK